MPGVEVVRAVEYPEIGIDARALDVRVLSHPINGWRGQAIGSGAVAAEFVGGSGKLCLQGSRKG